MRCGGSSGSALEGEAGWRGWADAGWRGWAEKSGSAEKNEGTRKSAGMGADMWRRHFSTASMRDSPGGAGTLEVIRGSRRAAGVLDSERLDPMSWADNAIWWHVYPLGFVGAPIRPDDPNKSVFESAEHLETVAASRLPHLTRWLDYMVEMGLNGLLLGPIFESSSHGYDTIDQFKIDPRLGTEKDFDDLVAACKQRGIRIVLDGVFSHVGYFHPQLHRALEEGPDGASAAFFDIDWDAEGGPAPRVWEGHGGLVRLDHSMEQVQDYVYEVMDYWLNRGVDGWRLDAAYSVPTELWSAVIPRVREAHPEAWFLGEVIHGDYPTFVEESKVDTVTQYQLWKALWSSLVDKNFYELDWSVQQNNEFLDTFIPNTFLGNHDVTRISTTVGSDLAITALVALMTMPGIPSIYYGDEQGYTGEKTETPTGDDQVRPVMPENPSDLSDLGLGANQAHRALIALRRDNPWLVNARVEKLELTNTHYKYRVRQHGGDAFLDVTLDLDQTPHARVMSADGQTLWAQP